MKLTNEEIRALEGALPYNEIRNSRRNKLSKEVRSLYNEDSIYYVYEHIDPRTRVVKYVGYGVDGRAYEFVKPCARRSLEHAKWASELFHLDYLPSDLVRVRAFGVSKKSAKRIEKDILRKCKERGMAKEMFNKYFPK